MYEVMHSGGLVFTPSEYAAFRQAAVCLLGAHTALAQEAEQGENKRCNIAPPAPLLLPHRASLAQPSHRTATSVSVTLWVSQSVRQTLAEHALQFLVLLLVPPASSLSLMEESPTRVVLSGFTEGSTRANIGAPQSESTFHFPS